MNNPSLLTLLFTNKCQLNCEYCTLSINDPSFSDFTIEEMDQKLADNIKETSFPRVARFTGGEPFIYFEKIKPLMEKYKEDYYFSFNTNGALLDEEKLKYLSNYDNIEFILSVDGGEKIAHYLRGSRYYQSLLKVLPSLLYYFPLTAWKTILSRKFITKLCDIYLEAQRVGFRFFNTVLDIREKEWTEEDFNLFLIQYRLLLEIFYNQLKAGIIGPIEENLKQYIDFYIINEGSLSYLQEIRCGVKNGAILYSMFGDPTRNYCCDKLKEYDHLPEKSCPNDPLCRYYHYCLKYGCCKDNYESTGNYFALPERNCILNRVILTCISEFLDKVAEDYPPLFTKVIEIVKKGG